MNVPEARLKFRAEVRAMILAAAREGFIQGGYDNFSLRALAGKIGYSPAAIYKHFKNKQEVFDTLADESFAALLESMESVEEVEGEDPVDRLKRGMHAYADFALRHHDHYRFAFLSTTAENYAPPAPRPAYRGLRHRVEQCVEAGQFANLDSQLAAQALWMAIHGVVSLLIQRPNFPWVKQEDLIETVISSAIQGLLAKERPRLVDAPK